MGIAASGIHSLHDQRNSVRAHQGRRHDCDRLQSQFRRSATLPTPHPSWKLGPEVDLTGSSRLKAGTAQKLICNTPDHGCDGSQMGYVYGNLMVNLHLKNTKLPHRGVLILESLHRHRCRDWPEDIKESRHERAACAHHAQVARQQDRSDTAPAQGTRQRAQGN